MCSENPAMPSICILRRCLSLSQRCYSLSRGASSGFRDRVKVFLWGFFSKYELLIITCSSDPAKVHKL
jgi:hypothetical protein